jgi:hypothetical protein
LTFSAVECIVCVIVVSFERKDVRQKRFQPTRASEGYLPEAVQVIDRENSRWYGVAGFIVVAFLLTAMYVLHDHLNTLTMSQGGRGVIEGVFQSMLGIIIVAWLVSAYQTAQIGRRSALLEAVIIAQNEEEVRQAIGRAQSYNWNVSRLARSIGRTYPEYYKKIQRARLSVVTRL